MFSSNVVILQANTDVILKFLVHNEVETTSPLLRQDRVWDESLNSFPKHMASVFAPLLQVSSSMYA